MLGGEFHQGLLAAGCCHQVSISSVAIDGDKAVAIGYMQLLAGAGEVFRSSGRPRNGATPTDED
jgi:hypothetical protein